MSWEIVLRGDEGQCKVYKCLATKCRHNKNKQCTLESVNIGADAKCQMYQISDGTSEGSALTQNPKADVQIDTDEYSFQQFHEA